MSEMTPEKLREVPGTRTVPSSVLDAFASAWEADLRDQDILKAHHDLHHKDDEASRARIEALEKRRVEDFVAGAKWWEYDRENATMWQSDQERGATAAEVHFKAQALREAALAAHRPDTLSGEEET